MFKKYRRTNIAEMRPVSELEELEDFATAGISISQVDIDNGSPQVGDMVARNINNYKDQWLVAKDYFMNNFEEIQ